MHDAYRQAALAAQAVEASSGVGRFDAFDPVYWVLSQQPEPNLRAFRDRLVGPIKSADDGKLWRTLVAYLANPDDLQTLAERLHIHVNTLRYRLKRIEGLIHQPLQRPETLAMLHLAEQVDAMLERSGS
ncbi:MAG: helix-turn-helix domain-containing protein [Deinococcales bacterium]